MARSTTMMSVALAAAAVSGLLPQLIPAPNPAPAPNVVSLPSAPLSGAPVSNPAPPGANPASGGPAISNSGGAVGIVAAAQPIRLDWNGDWAEAKVLFRNNAKKPLRVTLRMAALDRLGNAVAVLFEVPKTQSATGSALSLPPEVLVPLKVRLLPGCGRPLRLPIRGFLEVSSRSKVEGTVALDTFEVLIPEKPVPGTAGYVFLGSLLISGAIVLLMIPRLKSKGVSLWGPLGDPQWDFQKSWGTNVTIAAALLGSAVGFATFPEHPHWLTSTSLKLLQGLFPALVALAPLAYGLLKRDVQVQVTNPANLAGANVADIHSQGYVFMFLLAGGLVLWGALGEAATLLLLLLEFLRANMIDVLIGGVLVGLAGLLILLLAIYGWWTLSQVGSRPGPAVGKPGDKGPPPPPKPSLPVGSALSPQEQKDLPRPAPEWPLL